MRYTSSLASMHATTATCLLGGNGRGPVKVRAYSALLARYWSVTVTGTSSGHISRPGRSRCYQRARRHPCATIMVILPIIGGDWRAIMTTPEHSLYKRLG